MNWKRVATAVVLIPFAVALVLRGSTAPYLCPNAHLGFLFPISFVKLVLPPLARDQALEHPEPTMRYGVFTTSSSA